MVHYIYENLIERREEMEGAENVAIPRLGVDKFYHSMSKCLVLLLPYNFAMKSFINKADINMMKIRPIHVLVTVLQKSV